MIILIGTTLGASLGFLGMEILIGIISVASPETLKSFSYSMFHSEGTFCIFSLNGSMFSNRFDIFKRNSLVTRFNRD
ncbi:MAG: hypothetical protein ACTSRG_23575 [Candidatus Helarchaeota archaeon]